MFSAKPLLEMPRWEAAAVAAIIVALMGYAIIWLEWVPHMAILTAMVSLLVYGLCRGVRYRAMQDWMISSTSARRSNGRRCGARANYMYRLKAYSISAPTNANFRAK